MHLPGVNYPCGTRGEVCGLPTSKENSATWARVFSAFPSTWRSQGLPITVSSPAGNGGEVRLRFWELTGAPGVMDKIEKAITFGDMILML